MIGPSIIRTQSESTKRSHGNKRHWKPSLIVTPVPRPTSFNQRKPACACGGSCPKCQSALSILPKLKIGAPNDKYEQEADHVADQVMRMPESSIQRQPETKEEDEETIQTKPLLSTITPFVQRQVEPEEEEKEAELKKEEEEEGPVQAKSLGNKTTPARVRLKNRIKSLKGGGQPLPTPHRHFFESRMCRRFNDVRIHTNHKAIDAAKSANARAFTHGKDIFFAAGQYAPHAHEGKHLLAHELTHVIQQAGSKRTDSIPFIQRSKLPFDIIKLTKQIKSSRKIFPRKIGLLNAFRKTGKILTDKKFDPLNKISGAKWAIKSDSRASGDNFTIRVMQRYSHYDRITGRNLVRQFVKGVELKRKWLTYAQSVVLPPGVKLNQQLTYTKGKSEAIATSLSAAVSLIENFLQIQTSRTVSKGRSVQTSHTVTATYPAIPGHRLKAKYLYQLLRVEKYYLDLKNLKTYKKGKRDIVTGFGYAILKETRKRP